MTEHDFTQGLFGGELPDAAVNHDDAWFADPKNWKDIHGDIEEDLPVSEIQNEFEQVKAKIVIPIQKRGSDGNFYLYTTDHAGKLISLGNFLASDLFRKASQGKLDPSQVKELLALGNSMMRDYDQYGPRRHASDEYAVLAGDDELDWRDNQEKAAGEER